MRLTVIEKDLLHLSDCILVDWAGCVDGFLDVVDVVEDVSSRVHVGCFRWEGRSLLVGRFGGVVKDVSWWVARLR